ncbi:MAG: hypothetical protein WCF12_09165 [Propionicimonas sp.]
MAPIAFLVIMFGLVGVAQASGQWITGGRQQVVTGQQLSAVDLKGWMTLQQAADGLGIPLPDLIVLIGPPPGVTLSGQTAFKDLEGLIPGFELAGFRDKVAAHQAGGTPPGSSTLPPTTAPAASHTPTGAATASGAVTGSMSLRQVAEANQVDLAALIAEAGLPAQVNPDLPLRDLKNALPGFEVQAVRDAVTALR